MRFPIAALLCFSSVALFADTFPIGSKITELTVRENNTPVVISPAKANATVLIFVSTTCPVSNAYNERMNAIYKDYSGKGVQFVFLNPNNNESWADVEQHAKANGFAKVYKDPGNVLADQFGAMATPEAYVFDKTGTLQYHGYVDDSQNAARVQVQGLRQAIDAVMAGKAVSTPTTKAFGCTIKRVKKTS